MDRRFFRCFGGGSRSQTLGSHQILLMVRFVRGTKFPTGAINLAQFIDITVMSRFFIVRAPWINYADVRRDAQLRIIDRMYANTRAAGGKKAIDKNK